MTEFKLDAGKYAGRTRPNWQRGLTGNPNGAHCNVVSFDGSDIVGVAFVPGEHNIDIVADAPSLLALAIAQQGEIAELTKQRDSWHRIVKNICEEWNETCEPLCDSYMHDENCKAVSIATAKKAMREEIERLRALRDAVFEWAADRGVNDYGEADLMKAGK